MNVNLTEMDSGTTLTNLTGTASVKKPKGISTWLEFYMREGGDMSDIYIGEFCCGCNSRYPPHPMGCHINLYDSDQPNQKKTNDNQLIAPMCSACNNISNHNPSDSPSNFGCNRGSLADTKTGAAIQLVRPRGSIWWKNCSGTTSNDNWVEFWLDCTGTTRIGLHRCRCYSCDEAFPPWIVGAHVEDAGGVEYILPLCNYCNLSTRGGGQFRLRRRMGLAPTPV